MKLTDKSYFRTRYQNDQDAGLDLAAILADAIKAWEIPEDTTPMAIMLALDHLQETFAGGLAARGYVSDPTVALVVAHRMGRAMRAFLNAMSEDEADALDAESGLDLITAMQRRGIDPWGLEPPAPAKD